MGWQFISDPNALVCRVLKAKYFPQGDFLNAGVGHNPSFTWRSIWSSQDLLRRGVRWIIGRGDLVRVFQDPWIRRDGDFFVRSAFQQSLQEMKVKELRRHDGVGWDEDTVRLLFDEDETNEILRTPLVSNEVDDEIIWHYSNKGIYTVKSGYELARSISLDPDYTMVGEWKQIWKLSVPAKVKFFLWRALHNVLPTKANLLGKGVGVNNECVLCGRDHENNLHVFINCDFAKQCWQGSCFVSTIDTLSARHDDFNSMVFAVCSMEDKEEKAGIVMVMWKIWKERNEKLWNRKPPNSSIVLIMANIARAEWLEVQTVNGIGRNGGRNNVCGGWHNLEVGWSRCGADVAFFENHNRTGVGIIWQDYKGDFLEAKTITIPSCMRIAEGEAMGLHEALSWIKRKGVGCVEVVTDSKLVADAVNSMEEDNSEFGIMIARCRSIREECDRVHVKYIRREANSLAHRFARRSIDFASSYVWDEPPLFVEGLLHVPCVCG